MQTKQSGNAQSPYQKYGKVPFRYSEELMRWQAAVKRNDKGAIERHDLIWRKRHLVC